jgi:hypothetical protein
MVMVRKIKRRWSYKEDRRFIELAASKSLEEIAELMGRKPEAINKFAMRLGVSLKTTKAKRNRSAQ